MELDVPPLLVQQVEEALGRLELMQDQVLVLLQETRKQRAVMGQVLDRLRLQRPQVSEPCQLPSKELLPLRPRPFGYQPLDPAG